MFHLQIFTPEEPFFEGEVASLIIPGELGYLGVLKGHTPLITSLQPGTLTVTLQDHSKRQYKVDKGFFRFTNNKAVLLTDKIETLGLIEPDEF